MSTITVTPETSGSQRLYSTVNMLLRMPGTEAVSFRNRSREWYKLHQVNPVYGKIADAVLVDTVDGARLLFESEGTLPEPPDAGYGNNPWWERRVHMINAINALPGIHDYQYIGSRGVAFHVANEEARQVLSRLVVPELPDDRRTKVFFVISDTGPEPNDAATASTSDSTIPD